MDRSAIEQAVESIRSATDFVPDVGIVLGSGLGELANHVNNPTVIPYGEINQFPGTAVEGHEGRLVLGTVGETRVAVLQGRSHLYEGHSPDDVVRPVRVLARLGIRALVLTNAAGGINPAFKPGDLMIIRDHINLQACNPLTGPNEDDLGTRFPDMSEAYDRKLSDWIEECAKEEGIAIHNGVYAGMPGPTYETPAEIRMLQTIGADAIGMSTVAECIAANHLGVKVCGVSLITNLAAGLSKTKLTHEEVKETADKSAGYFVRLMLRVLGGLPIESA